ncbi:MAG: hypothetical protein QT03_C0001G0554 [archaeon GW2011_AR10]|uniref:Uncharacterized protein n=1 Tax=Candidatus Iainarchaeum sp. TaxID=3101447 RepID=A0A7J4IWD1_9ARCH|nr:MAG: hypothetical protein QT03_C0001G0554 [archaeon GW2011_AR10]HIH08579.1 hypothetical protein [Candidatus Diapherotrites archaeon]
MLLGLLLIKSSYSQSLLEIFLVLSIIILVLVNTLSHKSTKKAKNQKKAYPVFSLKQIFANKFALGLALTITLILIALFFPLQGISSIVKNNSFEITQFSTSITEQPLTKEIQRMITESISDITGDQKSPPPTPKNSNETNQAFPSDSTDTNPAPYPIGVPDAVLDDVVDSHGFTPDWADTPEYSPVLVPTAEGIFGLLVLLIGAAVPVFCILVSKGTVTCPVVA